jgi:hypothetical protein
VELRKFAVKREWLEVVKREWLEVVLTVKRE